MISHNIPSYSIILKVGSNQPITNDTHNMISISEYIPAKRFICLSHENDSTMNLIN